MASIRFKSVVNISLLSFEQIALLFPVFVIAFPIEKTYYDSL